MGGGITQDIQVSYGARLWASLPFLFTVSTWITFIVASALKLFLCLSLSTDTKGS